MAAIDVARFPYAYLKLLTSSYMYQKPMVIIKHNLIIYKIAKLNFSS